MEVNLSVNRMGYYVVNSIKNSYYVNTSVSDAIPRALDKNDTTVTKPSSTKSSNTKPSSSDYDLSKIYIDQDSYDIQKRMIESDPSISFGPRDIRNDNVFVGRYVEPDNQFYGRFGSTNVIDGTEGHFSYVTNTNQYLHNLAVAKAGGYGDISSTYMPFNYDDFQMAMNLGADKDLAGKIATGLISWNDVPSYLSTPTATIMGGTQNNADF